MRKKYEGTNSSQPCIVIHDEVVIDAKKVIRETAKAWGIESSDLILFGERKGQNQVIWLPKSEVYLEVHSKNLTLVDIRMPRWLAQEKFPDE